MHPILQIKFRKKYKSASTTLYLVLALQPLRSASFSFLGFIYLGYRYHGIWFEGIHWPNLRSGDLSPTFALSAGLHNRQDVFTDNEAVKDGHER